MFSHHLKVNPPIRQALDFLINLPRIAFKDSYSVQQMRLKLESVATVRSPHLKNILPNDYQGWYEQENQHGRE